MSNGISLDKLMAQHAEVLWASSCLAIHLSTGYSQNDLDALMIGELRVVLRKFEQHVIERRAEVKHGSAMTVKKAQQKLAA